MTVEDVSRIAKTLSEVQYEMREDLLDFLLSEEEELKTVLDPRTFSPQFDEIREKYLDKLAVLQGAINELANFNLCHTKRITRVESTAADTYENLTKKVNIKLARLEGCRIVDVKFLKDEESDESPWVSFITYMPNPLKPTPTKQPSKA